MHCPLDVVWDQHLLLSGAPRALRKFREWLVLGHRSLVSFPKPFRGINPGIIYSNPFGPGQPAGLRNCDRAAGNLWEFSGISVLQCPPGAKPWHGDNPSLACPHWAFPAAFSSFPKGKSCKFPHGNFLGFRVLYFSPPKKYIHEVEVSGPKGCICVQDLI